MAFKRHYTYESEDKTVTDSSYKRDQPYEFTVGIGKVVRGYDLGMFRAIVSKPTKIIA